MRPWQDRYGDPVVDEVRARVRERDWKRAVRGVVVLLRYHLLGLALLNERRIERRKLAQELAAHKQKLKAHKQKLKARKEKVETRGQQLRELKSTLVKERQRGRRLRKRIQRLTQQLRKIQDSRTQKLLRRLGHIRDEVLGKLRK